MLNIEQGCNYIVVSVKGGLINIKGFNWKLVKCAGTGDYIRHRTYLLITLSKRII